MTLAAVTWQVDRSGERDALRFEMGGWATVTIRTSILAEGMGSPDVLLQLMRRLRPLLFAQMPVHDPPHPDSRPPT